MNRLTADGMDFEEMFCAECPHYGEPNGCNFQRWGCDDYGFFVEAARRLKQYEDTGLTPEETDKLAKAQEEGRLVELPCKVGEIVYSPDGSLGGSWSGTVKEIVITDDGITLYIQSGGGGFYERASNVRFSHTRTEALKEQEG